MRGSQPEMSIELCEAAPEDRSVLQHLLQLYLHDYSEFVADDVGEDGLFGYEYLDLYWAEPERRPLLIRVDGRLAGFVLVREGVGGGPHSIAEFLVMRAYRRRGVGRAVAHRVFDMLPGRWVVQQSAENTAAQAFWRRVIGEYTDGQFTELAEGSEPRPPGQEFTSTGGGPEGAR
jgi:predicted acetyltransferase